MLVYQYINKYTYLKHDKGRTGPNYAKLLKYR